MQIKPHKRGEKYSCEDCEKFMSRRHYSFVKCRQTFKYFFRCHDCNEVLQFRKECLNIRRLEILLGDNEKYKSSLLKNFIKNPYALSVTELEIVINSDLKCFQTNDPPRRPRISQLTSRNCDL